MKIEEHKKNIQEFANKWKLIFEDEGEIGLGRECVGLLGGESYVAFNPLDLKECTTIEEYYNEELYSICPEDAYHKGDYLAVLGRGDDAIVQLSEWVTALKEMDAEIRTYETGAVGLQAMFSGIMGKTIYIPNNTTNEN